MTATIVIEGIRETQLKLEAFGVEKIPKAMGVVLTAGAKPLRAAIRAAAPVSDQGPRPSQSDVPGNLRASVKYKAVRKTGRTAYVIGAFGKGSAHRHLVIYGHEIKGHNLYGAYQGSRGIKKNIARAGERTTPNDFIARGREAGQAEAIAAVEAASKVAIEEATKL